MILLILLLLAEHSVASLYGLIGRQNDAYAAAKAVAPISNLQNNQVHVKSVFDVVGLVQQMPPCNKIATSMLMNTCTTSESSASNMMDSLSTIYGTRLAVCELYNAGAEIPAPCAIFVPNREMLSKVSTRGFIRNGLMSDPQYSYHAYDAATAAKSKQCTKALFRNPQSWTSFSNSKQNSFGICQAMRADIDKEELTQVLATVKRQSEEFMETTENSLEMVKQLQQAAVRSNQQYLDSQTVIQETSHALANSISLSKKEFTDVFTWLLESSLEVYNMTASYKENMRAAAEHFATLSRGAVEAQKAANALDDALGLLDAHIHDTSGSVKLLDKSVGATMDSVNFQLGAMSDKALEANSALEKVVGGVLRVTSFIGNFSSFFTELVIFIAIFFSAVAIAFPIFVYTLGLPVGASLCASLGYAIVCGLSYAVILERDDTVFGGPTVGVAAVVSLLLVGLAILLVKMQSMTVDVRQHRVIKARGMLDYDEEVDDAGKEMSDEHI